MKILIVEDNLNLADDIRQFLTDSNFIVEHAENLKYAEEKIALYKYDAAILDLGLPDGNGLNLISKIKKNLPECGILILTAKDAVEDKVKGLEKGADDYLTKPFHLQELMLRVNGMLKRKSWYKSSSEKQPVFKFGDNEINFETLNCLHGEEEIRLTPQEAMLLKYLVERNGKIVSRKELLENVWHLNPDIETRTVDIFIARLRKYFESDPANPVYFKSIRGAGYMFEEK